MKLMLTVVFWLLLLFGNDHVRAQAQQLRGDSMHRDIQEHAVVNDTSVASISHPFDQDALFDTSQNHTQRRLDSQHSMFEPLNCNVGCTKGTTTWKQEGYNRAQKITIPCGKCVVMNYDASDVLALPGGLNIEGTLRFPNGYKITIKTPFVHVQGNLEMYARSKVTGEPSIKFLMTGTDEVVTSFVPADNNRFKCSPHGATNPSPCLVGKKAFVVAGGKVTIRGVPSGCRTWTILEDIDRAELPNPTDFETLANVPVNPSCPSNGRYVEDDFSTDTNVHGWTGGYGALFDASSNGHFLVSDRKDPLEHGPTLDLRQIRDCLVPEQTYLFRARIMLTKPGVSNGTLTTCARTDNYCLWLHSTVKTTTGQLGRRMKEWEDKDHAWHYGQWQDFHATVTYTEAELNPNNIYQILQLRGPEQGVDIAMDDVLFTLPPPEAVPNPSNVCGGNIVLNGNAELDAIHPYPVTNVGGVLTVQEGGNGNQYFHQYSRSSDIDSIVYVFDAPDCLVANGKYKVSARIRVQSNTPVESRIELRSLFTNGTAVQRTIADCNGSSSSSWTLCETPFTLLEELTGDNLQEIRLQFETMGAPEADVDIDDMKLELLDGSISSIVVPADGVSSCWDAGSEILITSHTLEYDAGQVRRLISPPKPYGNGFVKLDLDAAIVPATTRKESPDFAVEVALLSRNILFEGDTDDSDSLHGAHFMVMHTPDVEQLIEGVEFKNFGQQGVLGKYPIHFHMCDSVEGSVVSKNSIRQSNQRCVVVHGTHNLTMIENVAYDTAGHCYLTEDGGEVDNVFRDNLGASTHAVLSSRTLGPLDSDDFPSTFWCSNPMNEWIGNRAAGSRNNGFWFELQTSVRGPTAEMPLSQGMNPRLSNLKQFRDNVAHSNGQHGLRTYPQGFLPPDEAVFYNTRSYRNKQEGVFMHNSRNLAVQGGILADNRIQFDFDRAAENIRLQGTKLIGVTNQYKYVTNTQPEAPSHESVTGIELHGFTINMENDGALINSVEFSGFSDTGANHTALVEIDPEGSHGHFDYWTTLRNMTILGDVTPLQFDFRGAMANGIDNVYLTDVGSGMRPQGMAASTVSTVISNTPAMTHFIDMSKCRAFPERAYMYCSGTCLRTVLLAVPPSMTDDFVLRVNEQGDAGNFIEIPGKFDFETDGSGAPDEVANTSFRKRRLFAVALPGDSRYVFRFLRNGQMDWPTSVEMTFEKPQCPTILASNRIILGEPDPATSVCAELIKNGDMEASDTDYPYWLQHDTGLKLAQSEGISGSTALSEVDQRASASGMVGQYLDTRCLTRGQQYEVRAWVKLIRNGSVFSCDSINNCPKARLRIQSAEDSDGIEFSTFNMDVVNYFERPYGNGWNRLRGVFTVDARIEGGSSVFFFIERGRTGMQMFIDDVSISPITGQCNDLVFNGDFSNGRSSFWYKTVASTTMTMRNGNSLVMSDRNSLSHSPQQDIRTGCMKTGERYIALARVRLENSNGSRHDCDPTRVSGNVCPRMRLRSFVDNGSSTHDGGSIAVTDHGVVGGWYIMSGIFIANDFDEGADKSTLSFDNVSGQKDFVIDDVSIRPLPKNCNELFLNGDATYGDTPSLWSHWAANGGERIALVSAPSGNRAFRVYSRTQVGDGLHQYVDPRCLATGTQWKLSARMRLVSKSTGQGVACDPRDERMLFSCPPVRVAGWKSGEKQNPEQTFYMTNNPNWLANGYNNYEVEFTVNNALASWDRVSIGIRSYNTDWDLYVYNLSLRPL